MLRTDAPKIACLAEPVAFEVLRYASDEETKQLTKLFDTLPMLATPAGLWSEAAALGPQCRSQGITPGSIDLIIAALAVHHSVELITFDADFEQIAAVSALRLIRLTRPRG